MHKSRISLDISPWLILFWCAYYYIDPLSSFLPFLLSCLVHELSHVAAILLLGGRIRGIQLRLTGAILQTDPMPYLREAAAAAAGPLGGMLLLPLVRRAPMLALFAAVQSIYNLLPIYPLDGGRILRALLFQRLPLERALHILRQISAATGLLLILGCYIAALQLQQGGWLMAAAAVLVKSTVDCSAADR